jgi:hypothetical protein
MSLNVPNIDLRSPQCAKIEEWLAQELLETYRRLANCDATEQDTQQLRGRASLLTQMLEFRNLMAVLTKTA